MVGEYGLCFIIDTGATLSLIDSSVVDQLGGLVVKHDKPKSILGINGKYMQAESTAMLTFNIGETSFTHTFVSKSLFESLIKIEMESDIQVHGILGSDFLLNNQWIIDFDKLEVYTS